MPPDPTPRSLSLWVYTKSLSGLHISSACLDPCLLQRLAKRKQKKQVELDKCAFDPEHMEEPHNGGSFPMVNIPQLSRSYGKYLSNSTFLWWIFPNFHVPMVNIFQIPLSYGEYSPTFTFPWWIISNFHFPTVNIPKFALFYGECSPNFPFLWWKSPNIALTMVNIRQLSLSYGEYSPTFPFIWWMSLKFHQLLNESDKCKDDHIEIPFTFQVISTHWP